MYRDLIYRKWRKKKKKNTKYKSLILYFNKCKGFSVVHWKKKYNKNLSYY